MLTQDQLPQFQVVSFDLWPSMLLGTGYQNAKILSIMDSGTANILGVDTASLHANIYPTLPAGVPNDPTAYPWVKLLLANGSTTIIGVPWIKDSTLVVETSQSIQFTVSNITPSDQNTIIEALAAAGYTAVGVTLLTTS
jgi:hypothetical protein